MHMQVSRALMLHHANAKQMIEKFQAMAEVSAKCKEEQNTAGMSKAQREFSGAHHFPKYVTRYITSSRNAL